ncbi:MAG TPA: FecR domain-containing protein, partial [Ramlibacter sp.]
MDTFARFRPWRSLPWLAALVLLCLAPLAFAQQAAAPEADPPGRVGYLSYRQGSVVFAPEGEEEWVELPQNRPLTTGDRVWSDRGARAEVHLGSATVQVDGESHVGVSALDDRNAQFILMQGSVHARVRDLLGGENFEVDTPHLALRAMQPGDYRVDVDPSGAHTRVVVHSGLATVYGEGGQAVSLGAGQQASFS